MGMWRLLCGTYQVAGGREQDSSVDRVAGKILVAIFAEVYVDDEFTGTRTLAGEIGYGPFSRVVPVDEGCQHRSSPAYWVGYGVVEVGNLRLSASIVQSEEINVIRKCYEKNV